MKDKKLIPYIFGLITGVVLLPVTDELLNVLYSWIEVMKIKPSSIIAEWNEEVASKGDGTEQTFAIGFQAPDPELEEYYEEEEEQLLLFYFCIRSIGNLMN